MSAAEELKQIAHEMEALESRFVRSDSMGYYLKTEDEAKFKRLTVEAKSAMDEGLGVANDFSINLLHTANSMRGGFAGGISLAGVRSARELVEAAARRAERKAVAAPAVSLGSAKPHYVDPARIAELRVSKGTFDMTRLVRMCEELNLANQADAHISKAMLVRAIVDHVPPVFGCRNFGEVANNYSGSKSFRGSMQHLDTSLRNIADGHLHVQIRKAEVLPSPQQVDYRQDLDALLAEVVRISK